MYDRNAKSECILIKIYALVFESICERTTKFHEKCYLLAELLILKHRRQNVSVSNTALLPAVTCTAVRCCGNPFDILTIADGVGCCEQFWAYRLVLQWSRYKGERLVLSRCLASSTASASHRRRNRRIRRRTTTNRRRHSIKQRAQRKIAPFLGQQCI